LKRHGAGHGVGVLPFPPQHAKTVRVGGPGLALAPLRFSQGRSDSVRTTGLSRVVSPPTGLTSISANPKLPHLAKLVRALWRWSVARTRRGFKTTISRESSFPVGRRKNLLFESVDANISCLFAASYTVIGHSQRQTQRSRKNRILPLINKDGPGPRKRSFKDRINHQ
jgi:hypothetical protein